jgi:glycosyltransferase involved in cell wall biosynthesis
MKLSIEQEYQLATPRLRVVRPTPSIEKARIAIVHYWFVSHRGGERVVEAMASMFPQADLFSLVVDTKAVPDSLRERPIKTSFLQKLPGSRRWHRHLLPIYPLALEQFDLNAYDLVLSSESGPAKGVLTSARTCHVCYCHSPMRYLWDFYHQYKNGANFGLWSRPLFTLATHYLRMWDTASADRVDYFAANSRNVASRIRKHYRRESVVIYPPVNVHAGYLSESVEDYYLVVGQLVDYKRMDLAIGACNRLGRRLHVVGKGDQYGRLRKLAGPSIHFCGALSDKDLHEQYAHCRALLFPGEEDFGIVPVEALSFGRPVIAYDRGGVTETVKALRVGSQEAPENATGVFFSKQSVDSLVEAICRFEEAEYRFRPNLIKEHADRFAPENFERHFRLFLTDKWEEFHNGCVEL